MIINIAEEAVAIMVELDRQVDFAEGEGLRKRWEFGMELLTLRVGKKLPNGLLDELVKETKKSREELQFRCRFAERFDTEDLLCNAITQYKSWYRIVNEALSGKDKTIHGIGNDELYTPAQYIEAARKVMGTIDLDPASSDKAQQTVNASQYYTEEVDGLKQPWNGRVWLNPPYSQPGVYEFVDKLLSELESGNVTEAILLTHNYTDTAWWHRAEEVSPSICFTRGRIKFLDAEGNEGSPTQGQCFFYFGENTSEFNSRFSEFGPIR